MKEEHHVDESPSLDARLGAAVFFIHFDDTVFLLDQHGQERLVGVVSHVPDGFHFDSHFRFLFLMLNIGI
jgi:hypothetical protein